MRIAIASDHAAFALKEMLVAWPGDAGHEVADLGPHSDARVDYPDYGLALAEHIAAGKAERGASRSADPASASRSRSTAVRRPLRAGRRAAVGGALPRT